MDTTADNKTAAVQSCEIYVSNIPETDTEHKLTMIFESERVTGLADCTVDAVTFDSNDSTCAIVKLTDQKGIVLMTEIRIFTTLQLCSRGLAMSICPSVRPSIRPSVKHMNCDKTKNHFLIPYERSNHLVFPHKEW